MKSARDKRFRFLSFVQRSLFFCLLLLGVILIGGTIYGLFFHSVPPRLNQASVVNDNEKGQTFTGIGRIRISTADPQPGMVILFVSFVYHPDDKDFSEELALRIKDFRHIIVDYIGSFSISELQKLNEEILKTELLYRFNAVLRLGQIETLIFSDFMIVG